MKKIISLFKRDYGGTWLVYNELVEGAEWVASGEGVATQKFDGTCCLIRDGKLYKRQEVKQGKKPPENFEPTEPVPDPVTGKWVGWVPVGDGPEDERHREAFEIWAQGDLPNGTYELIGPKVEKNPYRNESHRLIPHGQHIFSHQPPRDFEGLRVWFEKNTVEGIVWHHPDGRMVKIKRKDFGLEWPPKC